jgi:hypothetical protein
MASKRGVEGTRLLLLLVPQFVVLRGGKYEKKPVSVLVEVRLSMRMGCPYRRPARKQRIETESQQPKTRLQRGAIWPAQEFKPCLRSTSSFFTCGHFLSDDFLPAGMVPADLACRAGDCVIHPANAGNVRHNPLSGKDGIGPVTAPGKRTSSRCMFPFFTHFCTMKVADSAG